MWKNIWMLGLALGQSAAAPCVQLEPQNITVANTADAFNLAVVVQCTNGTFNVEWIGDVVVNGTFHVSGGTSLYISGAVSGSSVIDGGNSIGLFYVNDASLYLAHVNLVNGNATYGGAIFARQSDVHVVNCSFAHNNAGSGGAGGAVSVSSGTSALFSGVNITNNTGGSGGAIVCMSSTVLAFDSVFSSNTAPSAGGALFLLNCAFTLDGGEVASNAVGAGNNGEAFGGGIAARNSTLTLMNTWVHHNYAGRPESRFAYAGAVFILEGTLRSSYSNFSSNALLAADSLSTATGEEVHELRWGGAVFAMSAEMVMVNNVCEDNNADHGGCALLVESKMTAESTTFKRNVAIVGGAVWLSDSQITLDSCDFSRNYASTLGGAVYMLKIDDALEPPSMAARGTQFRENVAPMGGGGVAVTEASTVHIENSLFLGNLSPEAEGGGLIIASVEDAFISTTTFRENEALIGGGGVWSLASGTVGEAVVFHECTFVDNVSKDGPGGGLASLGANSEISNCSFTRNVAETDGGGLWTADFTNVTSCLFEYNEASGLGPAIRSGKNALTDVKFRENTVRCGPALFIGEEEGDRFGTVCSGCSECPTCETMGNLSRVSPVCKPTPEYTTANNSTDTVEDLELREGYWRSSNTSLDIFECINQDACVGGSGPDYCAKGYTGTCEWKKGRSHIQE